MDDGQPLRVARALFSSHDGSVFLPLASALSKIGVEIWATSGTRDHFERNGIRARSTEELTGIGSWFSGRVKTLHPAIFGSILAPRDEKGRREMDERGIIPFDLVAVNLYPFEEGLRIQGASEEAMTELIDIGGVALLRAAAKNFRWVVPVSSANDAEMVMKDITELHGRVRSETRRSLAQGVFERTTRYDSAILSWLSAEADGRPPPTAGSLALRKEAERLRYGENPHQKAWVYSFSGESGFPKPWPLRVIKGEGLSYTNYLDIENTLSLANEFVEPSAVVAKHATPCGVAAGNNIEEAVAAALETDPVARYGCAIALNRPVSLGVVEALKGTFVDLITAPGYDPGVVERFARRTRMKAVQLEGGVGGTLSSPRMEARTAAGRLLVEECDQKVLDPGSLRQVSRRSASKDELSSMIFAWKVVRHVRSNAIVLSLGLKTLGIGGGQTSRVGAVRSAIDVAGERARGAVMASDAYFPFRDGLDEAGKAGVTAVIQPGGSIRDSEVIGAADSHGMAMYFTGWRVFKH